ncbi:MAG: hypothetical protein ABIJ50_01885 [Pseudomonadota bacterium]
MTPLQQFIHFILWLLTPEPSDNTDDNDLSTAFNPANGRPPLRCWIKALFWYGIALTISLLIGNHG